MKHCEIVVPNRRGIHARAAAKLVHHASRFTSNVVLYCNGRRANARSMIAILVLAAGVGAKVGIEASGVDEAEAMQTVARLISDGFGEA
jgi:phosphocarrier protein HPr